MPDDPETPAPIADASPTDPPADPPASDDPPQADSTDWKAQARKHEREAKKLRDALAAAQQAAMTDQEKAIAEAKAAGRTEALTESAQVLAQASFRTAAAEAGVRIGDIVDLIDVTKFVTADGTVDTEGITGAVAKFASIAPATPRQPTADVQGGTTPPGQLTRADLQAMTADEIVKAKADGRLNTLIGAT